MLKSSFLALLIAAAPAAAFAQSAYRGSETAASPTPTGNLNNPQAQANMAGQPSNAHAVPGSGDAKSIPTPVITGHPVTKIPAQPVVPK